MAKFQAAEKPKQDSEFRRQRVFPAPYPLPYPAVARTTKASAKTNDLFALYRDFYRIVYSANWLT